MKPPIASQKRRAFLASAVALGAAGSGCGSDTTDTTPAASTSPTPTPVPCPSVPDPVAITVKVVDAATDASIASPSGSALHADGTTVPLTLDPRIPGQLSGGSKRGYWTVTVRATGYRDWSIDGVGTPVMNPCPQTHELTARLVRSN